MSATIQEEPLLTLDVEELAPVAFRQPVEVAGNSERELKSRLARGYSGMHEQSTPFHSFLEHSTLLLFPFVFGPALYVSLARLYHFDVLWSVLLAIPLGIVAGDFVSGIVHWFADTYFTEKTPIIGRSLVKPFRLHHIYPRDICTHNLVEIAGNVCILAVPVLSMCLYLLWLLPESGWLAFKVVCVSIVAITTVATNQFHKWAHEEHPSPFARWMQRTRLVLNPLHHQQHHTAPFNLHYCITNGWLNPLLNRIKFFRRMEKFIGFFGLKPSNVRDHLSH
ncbi:MAG TPA: fatty acid desaturase CarF family protein [Pyrinomonadaceae bacterium]|nr:fatty acid desaturase CarF family protein [Pyrinomonadaceae bacterium]